MDKIKNIAKWAIPAAMVAMPLLGLAQITPGGLNIPTGQAITLTEVQNIIIRIANWLMILGVIIAVLFLAWGGIKYMTAGGDSKKSDEGKALIKNAFIGLIILFGIGVILRTAAGLISRTFFS